MIELDFLRDLIRAIDESSLDSVEIERGGTRIRLAKSPNAVAVAPSAPVVPAVSAAPVAPAPGPAPAAAPSAPPAAAEEAPSTPVEEAPKGGNWIEVTSPMVGTFYRAPAPDAPSYVEVGSSVRAGDTLCIIEAMKLMNELPSDAAGKIVEICVEDAEPVEYGQVLFRIDPDS